jgi:hypothetical protein
MVGTMSLLRILRHGPLVFWTVVALTLFSVSAVGLSRGEPFQKSPRAAADTWSEVDSWRASLSKLPLLASSGEVSSFAKLLKERAETNAKAAELSGDRQLAEAWSNAAASAQNLAVSESYGQERIQAAIREVSIAGDRLAAAVSGLTWIPAELPETLDLGPVNQDGVEQNQDLPVDRLVQ